MMGVASLEQAGPGSRQPIDAGLGQNSHCGGAHGNAGEHPTWQTNRSGIKRRCALSVYNI
jgi:hypothetical protein